MVKYHAEVVQGSEEWAAMRCGILTASEMKLAITPTLKIADNDKTRQHIYELLAQRITKYVEPHYVSDQMLRGQEDEIDARLEYAKKLSINSFRRIPRSAQAAGVGMLRSVGQSGNGFGNEKIPFAAICFDFVCARFPGRCGYAQPPLRMLCHARFLVVG